MLGMVCQQQPRSRRPIVRASAGNFHHRLGYPIRVPLPVDRFLCAQVCNLELSTFQPFVILPGAHGRYASASTPARNRHQVPLVIVVVLRVHDRLATMAAVSSLSSGGFGGSC